MGERPEDSTSPPPGAADLAAELERARRRIAFYEGFDRVIQENIARSGELLRQALAERDAASQEIASARADVERRLDEQRQTLIDLAGEVQDLGRRLARLSQRILDALEGLGGAPDAASTIAGPAAEPPPAAAPVVEPPAGERAAAAAVDRASTAPAAAGVEPVDLAAGRSVREGAATTLPTGLGQAPPEAGGEAPRPIDLIVHGMPGAVAALSFQRHLASLESTESVVAREFLAGVARFEVVARGPLSLDDLRRWDGAAGMEPIHLLPNVIELKLPGAVGV